MKVVQKRCAPALPFPFEGAEKEFHLDRSCQIGAVHGTAGVQGARELVQVVPDSANVLAE